ncbi:MULTISPECIES: chromophore lyase CpcT/CpeT [unclassified Lentimicrobium]|uniref:chromophore lyase CpcT/CpeT n=1 Tax=unclassified Lentimicrobium TaxID=2677434 RepID=UPI0015530A82|nr:MULTISPECIES: chromophore lyase CpcT/CpeT [unclassified Lentimicrobium]NPD44869.1 hypothetical protein [Lentimicrobium sp. S6]NPD83695.1 hypothetical protein [Lentimicrobium sp. L6]
MKFSQLALAILIFLSAFQVQAQKETADLPKLVSYMEGAYSSLAQSEADTNFLHITLDMKQIWPQNKDGAWLYVEQTAAWTPGKPYRQRVYHLQKIDDTTFTSSIMTMPNPKKYIGGHLNTEIFNEITSDSLTALEGCALTLIYKDGVFAGSTEEGACKNSWGEANYATSIVEISPELLYSWDQGWNNKKEQVWGATSGGYKFVKKQID